MQFKFKMLSNACTGDPVGTELHGKTLGIVGPGYVGSCLAAAARGLGMRVIR